jgi:hypothetical protein
MEDTINENIKICNDLYSTLITNIIIKFKKKLLALYHI